MNRFYLDVKTGPNEEKLLYTVPTSKKKILWNSPYFSENCEDTKSKGSEVGLHFLYNTLASSYSNYMKYGTVRYFRHAHFIPVAIVGVGKRGEY